MATQNVTGFVLTVYGVWRNGQSVTDGELLISWQSEGHRISLFRQSEHKESDSGNTDDIFPRSLCLWISGQHHLHSVAFRLSDHECSVLHRGSLDHDEFESTMLGAD